MTAPLRQSTPDAIGEAPVDPITWASVRRTLVISGLIGVFLSFVGAFGSEGMPFIPRTLFMVSLAWIGTAMGMLFFRLVVRMRWTRDRRMLQGVVAATLMTVPMAGVVWGATQLIPHGGAHVHELPTYLGITFVMCQAMCLFAVFMNMRSSAHARAMAAAAAAAPPPPRFLERLPLKLRGAEVWAVESEDHYLRLHTSKGQDLILMRLADAIAELDGIEGAQVHRSWWVARDAIVDAERGDGRATLTLKDSSQVPVSRTYAKVLREKRWI